MASSFQVEPLTPAFCAVAAQMHQTGFDFPWGEEAFASLLSLPTTIGWINGQGLLLTSRIADEMEILTICVLPQYRRQGVGGLFLDLLFTWAAQQGVGRIFLEVSAQNESAQRLYLKKGFRQIGVRKNYYKTKNGFCDALCMEKQLQTVSD